MDGNYRWGSVVSQNLKSGWGLVQILSSFSKRGNQWVTKCRFLNISQCPSVVASLNIWIAISSYPPPIDNSFILSFPTVLIPNSSSSFEGSLPALTINKIGFLLLLYSLKIYSNDTPSPNMLYRLRPSQMKLCNPKFTLSGLMLYSIMILWN